ncbi:hypothetical protein JCM19232_5010 [Vibrio ishigakensis]|uniref:Uncharacterized protein n=1 Tax=Vibrio ishigakensis TaxID=1481914 RepID=A0A0B8PEY8_9VIBR|nr:hypothetical protein JCM19232_5010 [Vibrio ishigakensis]
MALNEINDNIQQIHLNGTLKLYALMDYLAKEEGLPSKLFVEGETPQYGVLYLLEEHITQGFDVETGEQLAPVSILVQHERAQELVPVILRHGTFLAELKEWNSSKQQAHIVIHPVI